MLAKLDTFLGPIVRSTNVVLIVGFAMFIHFVAHPISNPSVDAEDTFKDVAAQLEADHDAVARPAKE